jgi:hypothetical protein
MRYSRAPARVHYFASSSKTEMAVFKLGAAPSKNAMIAMEP